MNEDVVTDSEVSELETEDAGTEESSTEGAAKGETQKRGAQARIQELVAAKRAAEEELQAIRSTVSERDSEIAKLVDLLGDKEEDSRLVQKIRELHANPKFKSQVEMLDKAIRGEVEDIEEDDAEKPKGKASEIDTKTVEKLIRANTEKLSQEQLDLRADLLLDKSERQIERLMTQLPTEYGEEDRRILSSAIRQNIDWDGIEDDPKQLSKLVQAGVQKAIDWYGAPKGQSPKDSKNDPEPKKVPSAAEKLAKLKSQDYGKLKAVETKRGNKVLVPEIDDQDFTQLLAEALRTERESRG